MKKILSYVLLCAMLLSALSVGIFAEDAGTITADTSWYDNRADGQTEFTLKNENELAGFNTLITRSDNPVYFENMTVYLGADLDMKDYAWNSYGIFQGTFDGQDHSISNLTPVEHSNGQRRGMFGYASGTIRNFSLINPDVGNSKTASVGAIVGDRNQTKLKDQPLTIENVHVVNGKVAGTTSVGGILGNTNDGGNVDSTTDVVTVKNCSFSGTITGAGNVGGMVGYAVNVNTLNIEDCVVSGTVSGSSTYVGGVLGYTKGNTTIRNCSVKGTVSGTGDGTGGLVGYVLNESISDSNGMKMEIDSCHVNVQISGAGNHKGGLVGRVHTTKSTLNFTIQNCLAEGRIVLSANQAYMAGIVAWMNYSGQTLNASFENVITAMECNSNTDGTPHSNFKAFGSANSDKTGNNKITVSLINVWGNSDVLNGRGEYDSNTVTVSSGSTNYGLKTTEELKTVELEGWTIRPAKYPLPNKLISEGENFVWGYQEKANDFTTDYRFVAVLELADTKTLADYSDVGFVVTLINDTDGTVLYRDERVSGKVVYTKITGTGTDGERISYTPQYYGDYLFALVLKDVDNNAEFTVKLTPYATDANGNDQLGRETEFTVKKQMTLDEWLAESQNDYYADVLKGVTVNAIGDSYFEGNGLNNDHVWLSLMAKKYDMTMNNYGKNGSTVSNYVTNYNPMCNRYQTMIIQNPTADIILVEGGRNDSTQNVPIGSTDRTNLDTKTYCGALNVILDGIQKQYPNAMIVCITPWNFNTKSTIGLDYDDYADAMRSVAEHHGAYCIYACDPEVSGVNMRDDAFRAKYCMKPGDNSHLNLEGMKIAMTHFERVLADYYQDFLNKKA